MKKTRILILVLINILVQLSAIEPARTMSFALPGIIQISDFENHSSYDIGKDLSDNEAFLLTIPQQVCNSKLKLKDAFSWKLPAFSYDVYNIYSSRNDFKLLSGDGTIDIFRLMDLENGELEIHIRYNNLSIACFWDNSVHDLSLSGDVIIILSFFTEPIVNLKIIVTNATITGDSKDLNGTLEIVFNSKENAFEEYYNRKDWETGKKDAINLLKGVGFINWKNVGLSALDSDEDFIEFARSNKALDLLDFLTVYCIEKENEFSDIISAFSRIVDSVMYVNGKIAKDIKLSSAIDVFNFIMGLIF